MNEPVIIDAVRTAYGKRRGAYRDIRPDSLLADAVSAVIKKSGVQSENIEDLIVGCVSQAGEQAANVGRIAALLAGLPSSVPGILADPAAVVTTPSGSEILRMVELLVSLT